MSDERYFHQDKELGQDRIYIHDRVHGISIRPVAICFDVATADRVCKALNTLARAEALIGDAQTQRSAPVGGTLDV